MVLAAEVDLDVVDAVVQAGHLQYAQLGIEDIDAAGGQHFQIQFGGIAAAAHNHAAAVIDNGGGEHTFDPRQSVCDFV